MNVEYVSTEAQLADFSTKLLGKIKFLEFREKISVAIAEGGTDQGGACEM